MKRVTIEIDELVRCRDCKNWARNTGMVDSPNGYCSYMTFVPMAKGGKRMSEKLISADRLIQFVENWGKHHGREEAADSFLYAIHNAPAVDAVEVVRCVECWHRFTGHFGMMCIGRPNDFFCANGERREEE